MISRPLRIGLNAAFYTGGLVGVDVLIRNLVPELSRHWDLFVYSSKPEAFADSGASICAVPAATDTQRRRILWTYLQLPELLARDRIQLLISPFSEQPPSLRIPSIAIIHDLTPLTIPGSSPPGYTALFWLSLRMLRRATWLVTGSRHTRNDVRARGWFRHTPIRVIYHASRFERTIVGEASALRSAVATITATPAARPFLLYVGGFLPHKNVGHLLAAFGMIQREVPHLLVLVGWGSDHVLRELGAGIHRLGLEDRVVVLSGLSDHELAALYSHCALFVFPSRYEGFGLPVLEAMSCGAPVLCSRATSLPEVGGEAVEYFDPSSVTELASKVKGILSDAQLRAELGVRGLTRARLFSWRRSAAAYTELICEVLAGRGLQFH
jgi:alpha-1,3-rhamnosyl/mannosyltransferase